MAIVYEKLKGLQVPEVEHRYTQRDTMLYALGVGLGADPTDAAQLPFVSEKHLKPLPTLPVVLGTPGNLLRTMGTGINYLKVVHGEQSLTIHRLPAAEGTVLGRMKVTGIVDKGKDKGALIYQERQVVDRATGEVLCTLHSTTFARADGGYGGPSDAVREPREVPGGEPDASCDLATLPQAALIYRLSGDYNPLHSDPDTAKAAGFPRPILHGLCTFGVAGHALLKTVCGYDPLRLKHIEARFSSPVYPGETIRTEMWRRGKAVFFRARVAGRDAIVLANGYAEIA
ncbi:MAG: MaoC/PaaZ C-terminal domain-containing protein [SAR324 cluster bacterium]